jgi:hypothetical protein
MRLDVGLNGSDEEKASLRNSESSCQDRAGSITPITLGYDKNLISVGSRPANVLARQVEVISRSSFLITLQSRRAM